MQACNLNLSSKIKTNDVISDTDIHGLATRIAATYNTKLFVPDEDFYPLRPSEDDARDILKKLQRHSGIKHSSLQLHIDTANDHQLCLDVQKNPVITLGIEYLRNGFVLAHVLAHVFSHYLIASKHHITLSDSVSLEELADYVSIELGLGIIVANGKSIAHKPGPAGLPLPSYCSHLRKWLNKEHIPASYWSHAALASVESSLEYTSGESKLGVIRAAQKMNQATLWRIWSFGAAGVLIAVSLLVLAQAVIHKNRLQAQQQRLLQIQTLQTQYAACIQSVQYKQNNWDTDDIFIQRTINGQVLDCEQIKNRYEAAQN